MDKDLLCLVQREVKEIVKDFALHDARLDAMEEKFEEAGKGRREEFDKIMEKLVLIKKFLHEELSRQVQGLKECLAATNIKLEELGQGLAKTDDRVEQLKSEFHCQRMVDVKPG